MLIQQPLLQKSIAISSNGDNQAIAGVAGQVIRVYEIYLDGGTATDVKFTDGSGGTSVRGDQDRAADEPQRHAAVRLFFGQRLHDQPGGG